MDWAQRIKTGLASPKVIAWAALLLPLAACALYTAQPVKAERRAGAPGGDPAQLEAHVRALVACGPRELNHPEALAAAATYVESHLKAAGGRVRRQAYAVGGQEVWNVVARFGPEPTSQGPGLLVIGAHYDAYEGLPGADDNASGVAAMLEVARLLGEHPPATPVELVAWTLEEPPHFRTEEMGSRVHAKALKASGLPVRLVLALEMLGTFDDAPGSQRFPLPGLNLLYPSRGTFLALVGAWGDGRKVRRVKAAMAAATDLPIRSINAPRALVGIDFSDHASYWEEDLPALMLTDTAFFRNPRYHTNQDTPERLDYQRMGKAVRMISMFIASSNS